MTVAVAVTVTVIVTVIVAVIVTLTVTRDRDRYLRMLVQDGWTCLHTACYSGSQDMAKYFVEKGGTELLMMRTKDVSLCSCFLHRMKRTCFPLLAARFLPVFAKGKT